MITLEALRKEIQHLMLDLAEVEDYIYGNSKDSYDNETLFLDNMDGILASRHTFGGLQNRVTDLQNECH